MFLKYYIFLQHTLYITPYALDTHTEITIYSDSRFMSW